MTRISNLQAIREKHTSGVELGSILRIHEAWKRSRARPSLRNTKTGRPVIVESPRTTMACSSSTRRVDSRWNDLPLEAFVPAVVYRDCILTFRAITRAGVGTRWAKASRSLAGLGKRWPRPSSIRRTSARRFGDLWPVRQVFSRRRAGFSRSPRRTGYANSCSKSARGGK